MSARHDEVVVVGAGPTGLVAAALLRCHGIRCRVIDREPGPTGHTRAIGVSARSLEVLDEIGVADELVSRGLPSRVANFYAEGRPLARLTSARTRNTRFPYLLAVPQAETERVLSKRLRELDVEVERGVELEGLELHEEEVELREAAHRAPRRGLAAWVVAADGSHSTVRKALGIEFEGVATGRTFANVDAILDPPPVAGEGHYYFSPEGLLVIAPLPDGVFRVTALVSDEEADRELTAADVQRLIDSRAGGATRVSRLEDAGWGVVTVAVQARIATRFSAGRCFLAGDAAHVFGPTGAQGMNTGIQDAHNLAWKLALVARGVAAPGLLESYEAERAAAARKVLHAVEMQTKMATVQGRGGRVLRNGLLRALAATGVVDRRLAPRISQLDVDYGDLRWARAFDRAAPAGKRLPDATVGAAGETIFPLLRRRPFNLVVLGDEGEARSLCERLSAPLDVHVVGRTAGGSGLHDVDGALAGFMGHRGTRIALVRPDGHVAAAGSGRDLDAIVEHLVEEMLNDCGGGLRASRATEPPVARR
ncbi:MAG TPA: FAD-dependent monooxygenase [Solirubrobacterales bacterium]